MYTTTSIPLPRRIYNYTQWNGKNEKKRTSVQLDLSGHVTRETTLAAILHVSTYHIASQHTIEKGGWRRNDSFSSFFRERRDER
ncbi:hypothetical protein ANTPLA_LOCUS5186 [Anthophora plagiata]